MKNAQERKMALLEAVGELVSQTGLIVDMSGAINPLDAADADKMNRAFSEAKARLGTAWEAFANIYFPEGASLDLYLRSNLAVAPVTITGAQFRGHDISFKNESSGKWNAVYLPSLLGTHLRSDTSSKMRVDNLNRQLRLLETRS